jgi:hypothetical protein
MFLAFCAQHAAITLALSVGLVLVSYVVETATYKTLTFLEHKGIIERLETACAA